MLLHFLSVALLSTPSDLAAEADRIVDETMKTNGVPSISLAVVKDSQIAIAKAYGNARLNPATPARPETRYPVGSISKQFAATAVLMLAEEKKLSLDDPVARYLPNVTRAADMRVRELLSHTAGLQDYYPQDFVPKFMSLDIPPSHILDVWGKRPLDFEPGTKWQYSSTGYVAAGLIVEKVSGMPLFSYLQKRIFEPLGMSPVDFDQAKLSETDAAGYTHHALGPLRPAAGEGKGWVFSAGGLAMSASDLAKWNVALSQRRLLSAASYVEMETEVRLKNGVGAQYGLGLEVGTEADRRKLFHDGAVSGFMALNVIFPDEGASITVLTNDDRQGYPAAVSIAQRLTPLLFSSGEAPEARARAVFSGLQSGKLDRALFSENGAAYFTDRVLTDYAQSLKPLGAPSSFKQKSQSERGGMTERNWTVTCKQKRLVVIERDIPDGKIEQFLVAADEGGW